METRKSFQKSLFFMLGFAVSILLISMAVQFVYADWLTLGGNYERQSSTTTSFIPDYSALTGYETTGLIKSLYNIGEQNQLSEQSTPLISGDGLYLLTGSYIVAFNLSTNSLIWQEPVTYSYYGTPAIYENIICYGDYISFNCRDITNGKLLWTYAEEDLEFYGASPIIADGKVWTDSSCVEGEHQGKVEPALFSFDVKTGELLSKFVPPSLSAYPNDYVNAPALSDGIIYISTSGRDAFSGGIYAIDALNGEKVLWSYESPHPNGAFRFSPPVVYNDKVFAALRGEDTNLSKYPPYVIALNKKDGSVIWKHDVFSFDDIGVVFERVIPAIYAGKVYVAGGGWEAMRVFAFDEEKGELVWKSDIINGFSWSSPSVGDGKVIFGTIGDIKAFDSEKGTLLWSEITEGSFGGLIPLEDNRLFMFNGNAEIRSYDAKTEYNGVEETYPAEKPIIIDGLKEANTIIEMTLAREVRGTMSVSKHLNEEEVKAESETASSQFGTVQLKKFIDIQADQDIKDSLIEAVIKIYYTDDEIKSTGILDESLLRLYDWDTNLNDWVELKNSGVDTENNFVYGTTTHFSAFGSGSVQVDKDKDGVPDVSDNCVLIANSNQADTDKDMVGDSCDNCKKIANGNQKDTDLDGIGDACDEDIDNDGVANSNDMCVFISTAQVDSDSDMIGDDCDNCLLVANKDQKDTDEDNIGDLCDEDIDNDNGLNEEDNCPLLASTDSDGNFVQLEDLNENGIGDACEKVVEEGARQDITEVVYGLSTLTFINKEEAKKINKVIENLNDSLEGYYWNQENELIYKIGDEVYKNMQESVKELMKIKSNKAEINNYIVVLVETSREIAQKAVDEMTDSKKKSSVLKTIEKGDKEASKKNYDKAIEEYKKAWNDAKKFMVEKKNSKKPKMNAHMSVV